jgi:transcriptional regulator with XRE-family HTH domain
MALYIHRDKLKIIMKSKKFKPAELAKDIGVSRIYIYRILSENIPIGPKLVEGLLKKTGYKFEELFYFGKEQSNSYLNINAIPQNSPQDETLPPETMNHSGKKKQAVL